MGHGLGHCWKNNLSLISCFFKCICRRTKKLCERVVRKVALPKQILLRYLTRNYDYNHTIVYC